MPFEWFFTELWLLCWKSFVSVPFFNADNNGVLDVVVLTATLDGEADVEFFSADFRATDLSIEAAAVVGNLESKDDIDIFPFLAEANCGCATAAAASECVVDTAEGVFNGDDFTDAALLMLLAGWMLSSTALELVSLQKKKKCKYHAYIMVIDVFYQNGEKK